MRGSYDVAAPELKHSGFSWHPLWDLCLTHMGSMVPETVALQHHLQTRPWHRHRLDFVFRACAQLSAHGPLSPGSESALFKVGKHVSGLKGPQSFKGCFTSTSLKIFKHLIQYPATSTEKKPTSLIQFPSR